MTVHWPLQPGYFASSACAPPIVTISAAASANTTAELRYRMASSRKIHLERTRYTVCASGGTVSRFDGCVTISALIRDRDSPSGGVILVSRAAVGRTVSLCWFILRG